MSGTCLVKELGYKYFSRPAVRWPNDTGGSMLRRNPGACSETVLI